MKDDMTPFSIYLQGYKDGYAGKPIQRPEDINYVSGYQTGKEDDQFGMPNKYGED